MFRKLNDLLFKQGRLGNVLPAILENLGTSCWVPMSPQVLLNVFSKGFMKKDAPISRHNNRNVEMISDNGG